MTICCRFSFSKNTYSTCTDICPIPEVQRLQADRISFYAVLAACEAAWQKSLGLLQKMMDDTVPGLGTA